MKSENIRIESMKILINSNISAHIGYNGDGECVVVFGDREKISLDVLRQVASCAESFIEFCKLENPDDQ